MAMAVIRVGSDTSSCQAKLAPDERGLKEGGGRGGDARGPRSTGWAAPRGRGEREPPWGRVPAALSPLGCCPQGAVGWPWAPS